MQESDQKQQRRDRAQRQMDKERKKAVEMIGEVEATKVAKEHFVPPKIKRKTFYRSPVKENKVVPGTPSPKKVPGLVTPPPKKGPYVKGK